MEQTSFYKYISINNISLDELRIESDSESKLLYTKFNNIYLHPKLWSVITKDFYIFSDFERYLSQKKHHEQILNRQNEIKKISQSISQTKGNFFLFGGGDNYWHFLFDFMPRLACLKNLSCKEIKVIIPHNLPEKFFSFLIKVCNLLKLSEICFLKVNRENLIYYFESLIFTSKPDIFFTSLFYNKLFGNTVIKTRDKNLYIKRGAVEKRKVLNEDEVIKFLKKYKYVAIDCSSLSIEEQIISFSQAKNIIIPHGASMANLIFAPNDIGVIDIRSNFDWDASKEVLQLKESFNLHIFEKSTKVGKKLRKDIIVDILELEKLIINKKVF